MKLLVTLIFSIACFYTGTAQFNDSSSRTLTLEKKDPNLGAKKSDNSDFALKIPSTVTISKTPNLLDSLDAKQINMLPTKELVDPGRDVKINPRLGLEEKNKKSGDKFLGVVKSKAKFVGITVRDGGGVIDGDRVRILLNGKIVERNLTLTFNHKGINEDLKKGVNRIVIKALNEGFSPTNSAQLDIVDDFGLLIFSQVFFLSEDSKATVIIDKK